SGPDGVHNFTSRGGPARATLERYRPSVWRRGWDSNPRYPFGVHSISSAAPSAARSPLQLGLMLLDPDRKVKLEWNIVQSVAELLLSKSMLDPSSAHCTRDAGPALPFDGK